MILHNYPGLWSPQVSSSLDGMPAASLILNAYQSDLPIPDSQLLVLAWEGKKSEHEYQHLCVSESLSRV